MGWGWFSLAISVRAVLRVLERITGRNDTCFGYTPRKNKRKKPIRHFSPTGTRNIPR